MNQEQTIALWDKCQKEKKKASASVVGMEEDEAHQSAIRVWNAWAQERLDERAKLEKDGQWQVEQTLSDNLEGKNEVTRTWLAESSVDFSKVLFHLSSTPHEHTVSCEGQVINFSNFMFPSVSKFSSSTFSGTSSFSFATFEGGSEFSFATFKGNSNFSSGIFKGYSYFSSVTFEGSLDFSFVRFESVSDFSSARFEGYSLFSSGTFKGVSNFSYATFEDYSDFRDASFKGCSYFRFATFKGDTYFSSATFESHSYFSSGTFKGVLYFYKVRFYSKVDFDLCDFERVIQFEKAQFFDRAGFSSIISKRSFSLAEATFEQVPNFIEASFHEAPRLDNVTIPEYKIYKGKDKLDSDEQAKYRALKRLAVEGHDHKNEMDFFAGEIQAERYNSVFPCPKFESVLGKAACSLPLVILWLVSGVMSMFWGYGFWFLWAFVIAASFYGTVWLVLKGLKFSLEGIGEKLDFVLLGKEAPKTSELIKKPLEKKKTSRKVALFWFGMFYQFFSDFGRSFMRPLLALGLLFLISTAFMYFNGIEKDYKDKWQAASYLAGQYSLPFIVGHDRQKTQSARACLFGEKPNSDGQEIARLPYFIILWGAVQSLLSLIFLFLFGLAIRNHFKIK